MTMETLTPNLMVRDVNQTIDWYKLHLDFRLQMSVPEEGQFDWAMIGRDSVELMLQSVESVTRELPEFKDRPVGGSFAMYIRMNGLRDLYQNLKDQVKVLQELNKTFYGTIEFTVEDCNGYVLTLSERDS